MSVGVAMPEAARLLTVILHYGRAAQTARLHDQLLARGRGEIRVIDNAAPEPYARAAQRLERNLYWGGALAATLRQAADEGFSHLWFLNNDVVFLYGGAIVEYVWHRVRHIAARVGRVGVYSPSVSANPYHPQMVHRPEGDFRVVACADGIAPLMALDCWREIGLDWAENPVGYGLDVVFSARARELGWSVVVDHKLRMRHVYHASVREVPGLMARAARDEDAYLRRHWGEGWRLHLRELQEQVREYA